MHNKVKIGDESTAHAKITKLGMSYTLYITDDVFSKETQACPFTDRCWVKSALFSHLDPPQNGSRHLPWVSKGEVSSYHESVKVLLDCFKLQTWRGLRKLVNLVTIAFSLILKWRFYMIAEFAVFRPCVKILFPLNTISFLYYLPGGVRECRHPPHHPPSWNLSDPFPADTPYPGTPPGNLPDPDA